MLTDLSSPQALDAHSVGGKAAGLGRLALTGVTIPRSFAVPVSSFQQYFGHPALKLLVKALSTAAPEGREQFHKQLRQTVAALPLPQPLLASASEILPKLGERIVVRSSAVSEDHHRHSFAGQLSSYLGLSPTLVDFARGVKAVWLSLFAPGVLSYIEASGHATVSDVMAGGCAVIVQELIDAEKSGVLFFEPGRVTIEAVWGLGLPLVSGLAQPDQYTHTGRAWEKEIQEFKRAALVTSRENWSDLLPGDTAGDGPGRLAGNASLIRYDGGLSLIRPFHPLDSAPTLVNEECDAIRTAAYAVSRQIGGAGCDLEWAYGPQGLVILQARPVTVNLEAPMQVNEGYGTGLSPGQATGALWRPLPGKEPPEEPFVLLVPEITPDLVAHIVRAQGVVTAMGGRLSHGAILCRELKKPLVVCDNHFRRLRPGTIVCIDGGAGTVCSGGRV